MSFAVTSGREASLVQLPGPFIQGPRRGPVLPRAALASASAIRRRWTCRCRARSARGVPRCPPEDQQPIAARILRRARPRAPIERRVATKARTRRRVTAFSTVASRRGGRPCASRVFGNRGARFSFQDAGRSPRFASSAARCRTRPREVVLRAFASAPFAAARDVLCLESRARGPNVPSEGERDLGARASRPRALPADNPRGSRPPRARRCKKARCVKRKRIPG